MQAARSLLHCAAHARQFFKLAVNMTVQPANLLSLLLHKKTSCAPSSYPYIRNILRMVPDPLQISAIRNMVLIFFRVALRHIVGCNFRGIPGDFRVQIVDALFIVTYLLSVFSFRPQRLPSQALRSPSRYQPSCLPLLPDSQCVWR